MWSGGGWYDAHQIHVGIDVVSDHAAQRSGMDGAAGLQVDVLALLTQLTNASFDRQLRNHASAIPAANPLPLMQILYVN